MTQKRAISNEESKWKGKMGKCMRRSPFGRKDGSFFNVP